MDCENEMKDMFLKLSKLKSLSNDDKSENVVLRSRIDDQSSLIMMLKTRLDKTNEKLKVSERLNKELTSCRDEIKFQLDLEIKKCNTLDHRFNDLASNHEELIKFKDEYKHQNTKLKEENKRIKDENRRNFSKTLEDRNVEISTLKSDITNLSNQNKLLLNELSEHKQRLITLENSSNQSIKEIRKHSVDLEERLNTKENKILNLTKAIEKEKQSKEKEHQSIIKERDEMLELAIQRGKLIENTQNENKFLISSVEDMKVLVKDMEDKFIREEASVNANLRVKKLQQEIIDLNKNKENLIREYEAYKKHSADLLQKEKDLNERLRHLVG